MRFLRRQQVMNRLRMSQSVSYRIIGTARGSLISTDDVLRILNNARRGPQPMLVEVPDDLATPSEIAAELTSEGITEHDLHNWTLRTRNIPPFFLLNTHCRRFQRSAFFGWLADSTKIIRRDA